MTRMRLAPLEPVSRRMILAGGVASLFLAAIPAQAQQAVLRIAAVVNDEIISVYDVENRLRLTLLNAGLQPTEENLRRLAPDVLRALIDEKLQTQEASRNGVTATDGEVDNEINAIGERNNIPAGQLGAFLQQRGIDPSTLRSQIRTNISWVRLVSRRLRRDAEIGEDEIDLELERLRQNLDKPQNRVFEIFLPVDNPDREPDIRRGAESLVAQIRAGAPFSDVARTFSQSSTARVGGDLGWVPTGALPFEAEEALATLQPGQISDPVRTMTGYVILRLADRRIIQAVDPGQVRVELVQATGPAEALERIRDAGDCDALEAAADRDESILTVRVSDVLLRDLPGPVREAVQPLKPGQTSPVLTLQDRSVVVGICKRDDPPAPLPSRDEIKDRLQREKLDLLARRYLRDLRQSAFIDIRL